MLAASAFAAALAPEVVLTRYVQAIAGAGAPLAYTCEYNLVDRGTHPEESTHRIFRQGGHERDEIIGFNGESLSHPEVRIFKRRVDPYAVDELAPKPEAYAFTYVGEAHHGRSTEYVFNAFAKGTPRYEVTQLAIDGASFLPLRIAFRTHLGSVEGSGEVTYRKTERYWMPQTASARAEVNGNLETERIVWYGYQFFDNLPDSTFAAPSGVPAQD